MSTRGQPPTSEGSVLLMPAALGSFGVGALAAQSPVLGAGAGAFTILALMPWRLLMALLAVAAIMNRFRFDVGEFTIQPAHVVLVPLAVRVLLLTRREVRPRLQWPEAALLGFLAVQAVSSVLFSPATLRSLSVLGLLALGAACYVVVYLGLGTRPRLLWAARAMLVVGVVNAVVALLGVASFYLLGSTWGVGISQVGAPAAGLAQEYNILGSMSASTAMAFLVLMRERNPLFSHGFCVLGFWVCFLALMASLTRGAWIAFAVALLGLLVVRRRAARRSRVASIGLTSLALAVGLLALFAAVTPSESGAPNPVVARGSNLLNFTTGSGQARTSEWRTALSEVRRSPVIGLGTNSYGQRHEAPKKRPENAKGAYLGNLYIRTLYDGGLVALVLLLSFLAFVLWPRRALRYSRSELAPVAWAFLFMELTMAVAFGATDASFQLWPWIVLGILRASRAHVLAEPVAIRTAPVAVAAPADAGGQGSAGNGGDGGGGGGGNGHGPASGGNGHARGQARGLVGGSAPGREGPGDSRSRS